LRKIKWNTAKQIPVVGRPYNGRNSKKELVDIGQVSNLDTSTGAVRKRGKKMNKGHERYLQQIRSSLLGVTSIDGIPMVSSRDVADIFEKRHDNVLRDIQNLINTALNSEESSKTFMQSNFRQSSYKDSSGKRNSEFLMTKDGFALITMGFTGIKAMKFKISYINRFNEMERFIYSRNLARLEYPELTDMIKLMHDEPKFYHFSNEADMINKIVLGMTAKQFREKHNLSKDDPIRDHMTPRQADMIQRLQKVDVGLVVAVPDFQQRKTALQAYFEKLQYTAKLTA
jgi:Rha family phage regulatory protein